ncbi:MAG: hypothetical protein L6263_04280 [Desulfobacteraceae bacterium]|nr:hypothetical protein [Desulfobacteraceae bacterium]
MKLPHWHYFLLLEDELDKISRFIEINEENYNVYSIELTKLLLSICSEVDVVAKLLCKEVDIILYDKIKGSGNANISTYRTVIHTIFPEFYKTNVAIPYYNLSFAPWNSFKENKSPAWWNEYNDVKHERNLNFKKANLENILNSMSGLMILLVYLYGRDSVIALDQPNDPKLFKIEETYYRYQGSVWAGSQLGVPKVFLNS